MNFVKIQGAGNDFIVLDNYDTKYPIEQMQNVARQICQRRLSIGADGILIIGRPKDAGEDISMIYLNQDGSLGEMCGNGARCAARFAFEKGYAGEAMIIGTTAGPVPAWRLSRRIYKVQLNRPTIVEQDHPLIVEGGKMRCSYVELGSPGVPHAVVYYPGLSEMDSKDIISLAARIRRDSSFPKGANCNLYDIIEKNHLVVRTYERGVEDFTMACGTGCGSVGVITALAGICDPENIQMDVPGGTLKVSLKINEKKEIEELYLTGPTTMVAEGYVLDEELNPGQEE